MNPMNNSLLWFKRQAKLFKYNKQAKLRIKRLLLGQQLNDGLIFRLVIYGVLTSTALLYLNPLLYMISTSVQTIKDLIDPSVNWIPSEFHFQNYRDALDGLNYYKAFKDTTTLALSTAVIQVIMCAFTGYAFARLHIPGKNFFFLLVIVTFLVPQEILVIPLLMWYAKFHWMNTLFPFIIPAIFSQGLKAPLFIIIFRQFFARLPNELEESARMDGAGAIRTYFKIMLPLAKPAMLIVFVLAFVWQWNDYMHTSLFLTTEHYSPLSTQKDLMQSRLNKLGGDSNGAGNDYMFDLNEPIKMAASFLIILPPLVLYMFVQKYFVQGIERSGLVE